MWEAVEGHLRPRSRLSHGKWEQQHNRARGKNKITGMGFVVWFIFIMFYYFRAAAVTVLCCWTNMTNSSLRHGYLLALVKVWEACREACLKVSFPQFTEVCPLSTRLRMFVYLFLLKGDINNSFLPVSRWRTSLCCCIGLPGWSRQATYFFRHYILCGRKLPFKFV